MQFPIALFIEFLYNIVIRPQKGKSRSRFVFWGKKIIAIIQEHLGASLEKKLYYNSDCFPPYHIIIVVWAGSLVQVYFQEGIVVVVHCLLLHGRMIVSRFKNTNITFTIASYKEA